MLTVSTDPRPQADNHIPQPAPSSYFSTGNHMIHGGARVLADAPFSFITAAEQWSYAVELPCSDCSFEPGPVIIEIHLRVKRGSVGVGVLGHDQRLLLEEERTALDGLTTVSLPLYSILSCRSIMFRNTSPRHESSEAEVLAIRFHRGSLPPVPSPQDVLVDPAIFARFGHWEGITPAGYWTDWLGVRTRADVWAFSDEFLAVYNAERYEQPAYPVNDEHVLDWLPLLEAVVTSEDPFTMVSLGAGWGRWVAAGAFAAEQSGRSYRLVAVEAEPTHYAWLERHMHDNNLRADRLHLIRGAAVSTSGTCWFRIGNPAAWYGQSILPDAAVPDSRADAADVWSTIEIDGGQAQRVPAYDLQQIVADLPLVDYLHLDLQGSELDVLSAWPDLLQTRIRRVNVRISSASAARHHMRLFKSLGWTLRYTVAPKGYAYVRCTDSIGQLVQFGHGLQVWINSRLYRSPISSVTDLDG